MYFGDKALGFQEGVPSIEASLCTNVVDGKPEWASS